jgi:hypothetical protein
LASFSNGPPSDSGGKSHLCNEGVNQENSRNFDGVRRGVDDVCHVLESGSWGPSLENSLSMFNEKPQPELVIGVLRRLKDVNQAVNYFRWVERKSD